MKRKLITVIFAITLLANPYQSFAWGNKGHAIVAEVAFQYINAATRANVMKLLDGMSIGEDGNWMDAIKSDHANDYMKPYHYIDIEKGGKEMPAGDNIVTTLQKTLKELDGINTLSKEDVKLRLEMVVLHDQSLFGFQYGLTIPKA
ncbi:MAG TPA: S1/P1 nuclease [Flavobacterium sp.]|nr:S1/P1 nuclease [Flavobacterium sp.]